MSQTTFSNAFSNENEWISLMISLKFVPKVRINNIPAMVQIKAWRRPGDKPLSEPMVVSLPTHICVTRPQWVNSDFTSSSWRLKSPASRLLDQWLVRDNNKETINVSHYLSFREDESTLRIAGLLWGDSTLTRRFPSQCPVMRKAFFVS